MATWYYRASGKEIGPLKSSEIVAHVRQGKVTPDTLVRKNDSQWVSAREVGGLLEAADAAKRSEHVCPFCGEPIPRPPARCPSCLRDVVVSLKGGPAASVPAPRKAELTPEEAQERRQQQIAELQRRVDRRDIWVYSTCLLLWLVLLTVSPFLLRWCDDGTIALSRHVMTGILGSIGILFAVVAYWLTRPG